MIRIRTTIAVAMLVVASCTVDTGIETGAGPIATAAPTVQALPTAPPEPTVPPAPTAATLPTAVPDPTATAAPPAPTSEPATPEPTAPIEPELFQNALEEIRSRAALPTTGTVHDEFIDVSDDSGFVFATVPAAWSDVNGARWSFDEQRVGNALLASTDVQGFREAWGDAGVFIGASSQLPFTDTEAFLDEFSFAESCEYSGRQEYYDGLYTGLADVWIDCGPEGSLFVQISAAPADASYLIEVQLLAVTDQDVDGLIGVVESFTADPTVPDGGELFQTDLDAILGLGNLETVGAPYEDFVEVSDDSGLITASVPSDWTEIDGRSWDYEDELIGPALSVAPDLEGYRTAWGVPGIFIAASDQLPFADPDEFIQEFWFGESCTYEGEWPYDDGLYVGIIDVYTSCGDEDAMWLQLAAAPLDNSYLIEGQFQIATRRDFDAIITVIETFIAQIQ